MGERWNARRTLPVKDIDPGSSSSSPSNFASVGATLYFQATGVGGSELWKTDGTAMGTMLVKDINPGSGGSNPSNLTNVNERCSLPPTMGRPAANFGHRMARLVAPGS